MKIEFDVKMTTAKMYDYMLRHVFTTFAGIIGEVLGILLIVSFFVYETDQRWLYLIMGIVVVLYQPVSLYMRAKKQVLSNDVFKEPLHYVLDEKGITVSSKEDQSSLEWSMMYKAVSTTRSIIIYTTKINACIFPKEDMKDQKDAIIKMICTHMDPKQVNIKG